MSGIDGYTKLMLHCDGTNLSTSVPDSSTSNHTMTCNGGALLTTLNQEFGTASLLLVSATSSYVSSLNSSDFSYGTGDFTNDFWVRYNTSPSLSALIGRANADYSLVHDNAGNIQLYVNNGGTLIKSVAWSPSTATWYHFALTRAGTNLDFWLDGTKLGTTTTNSTDFTFSSGLEIGGDVTNGRYLNGWMDEIRISKGISRWNSNFTRPASAYTVDDVYPDRFGQPVSQPYNNPIEMVSYGY